MFFRLLFFSLFLVWTSCAQFITDQSRSSVSFQCYNILSDSLQYRLVKMVDGIEVADTLLPTNRPLVLKDLKEDMYIIEVSWPRQIIPHSIFKSKNFNMEQGDRYALSKAIYINPDVFNNYEFTLDTALSREDIELQEIKSFAFRSEIGPMQQISEQYWANYNDFYGRKENTIRALNTAYYESVNRGDRISYDKEFKKLFTLKNDAKQDLLFAQRLDSLVAAYPESSVSTFFVFYQLFVDRDFPKYKKTFERLRGNATSSKYYFSLQKQYLK